MRGATDRFRALLEVVSGGGAQDAGTTGPGRGPGFGHGPQRVRPPPGRARQHIHRTSGGGAPRLARHRGRFSRSGPVLRSGGGAPALGRGVRGGRRRPGRPALRLGRRVRSGCLALSRRLPQRIPALRRVPALGFAGGGARPQRQRDGVERREPRRTARRPPPGGARGARGAFEIPRALCAQRRVAAHRARDPEPPPRLSLRLRRPAARRTALGRAGGAPHAHRGRGVPHRPSLRRASGASRPDPARLPAPRRPRPARVVAVGRAPDRDRALRGEPRGVRGLPGRPPRARRTVREPAGTRGRGLRTGGLGAADRRPRPSGHRNELVGGGRLRALDGGPPPPGGGMAVDGGGPRGARLSLGQPLRSRSRGHRRSSGAGTEALPPRERP